MKAAALIALFVAGVALSACAGTDVGAGASAGVGVGAKSDVLRAGEYVPSVVTALEGGGVAYNPGPGYILAWSDEFSKGSIDEGNWNIEVLPPGYYNQELQAYVRDPSTAFVDPSDGDGALVIRAVQVEEGAGPGHYESARLNTQGKRVFQYGKIVARIKLPRGSGTWPAFWMLGADFAGLPGGKTGWPECGEVDIMEFFGGASLGDDKTLAALHGPGYSGDFPDKAVYTNPSGPFAGAYHVFEIEWGAGRITHMVDGIPFHTSTPDKVTGRWVYDAPFFLILNFAVGGFGYDPDPSTPFPQDLRVDWVREYEKTGS